MGICKIARELFYIASNKNKNKIITLLVNTVDTLIKLMSLGEQN